MQNSRRCRSNFGRFDYEYDIYEKPYSNLPEVENPPTVKPPMEEPQVEEPEVENQGQLNTDKQNTDELNTNELITDNKKELFIKKIKEKKEEYQKAGNGVKSFILATAWARRQPEYELMT